MTGSGFKKWFTVRHRKPIALAVAGWLSLSLVLALWPCCQVLAQDHSPVIHAAAGEHDHGNMPTGPDDPCRTWLDTADAAFNTSPDVLLTDFELKIVLASYSDAHKFPHVPLRVRVGTAYDPSPPALPLYLRVQHLLI